ncbi:MAG TPA: alpha/beta hydrolase [Acidimicrobiia bacterium]
MIGLKPTMIRPLPETAPGDPPITQGMAYRVVEKYLYSEEDAARMLAALQEAAHGNGTLLFRLYEENLEWEKSGGITPVVNQAITCADRAGFWDSISVEGKAAFREELDATAPRLGWRFGPNWIDPGSFQGGMCQIQPLEQSRMPVPVDAKDAGPILVIGTTGDVATPYEAAVQSVDDLDEGHLITVEADHHTAYFTAVQNGRIPKYRCLLDTVHAYLIDLQVPPEGVICTGE